MLFHDQQAEAFRHGQLHLPYSPSPLLAGVPDPYDIRYARYWVMDLSYYQGHYYLYWGPVPAAILALVKSVFGIQHPVGDDVLGFGFTSLLALVAILLLGRVRSLLFADLPRGLLTVSVFALALATPLVHGLASGSVYVAAITGGQAFLWLGLLLSLDALVSRRGTPAWLAGLALALSIGCRVSLAPAVALCGIIFAILAALPAWSWRSFVRWLLPIGLPCASAVGLLLVYNHVRFDRFFEFGTGVQLSAWKFRASFDYVLANLQSYLFRPWQTSCQFPYLLEGKGIAQPGPWRWIPTPSDYATVSPLVGIAWGIPILWALPVLGLVEFGTLKRKVRALLPALRSEAGERTRVLCFCLGCFGVAGTVTGLPEMGLNVATMRYEADVGTGLFLLGTMALWALVLRRPGGRRAPARRLRLVRGLAFAWLAAGTGIALLIGYQGYGHHFQNLNPELHGRLVRALSVCPETR
jgi:hypothetical protein